MIFNNIVLIFVDANDDISYTINQIIGHTNDVAACPSYLCTIVF